MVDGPEDHRRLVDADEQGPRGDRGPRAVRRRPTTTSRSSSTRSRSCTRWSSSPTAPRSPSSRCPTCACRSATRWPTRTASARRSAASTGPTLRRLDFEPPDLATFRCLGLAYAAGRAGGTAPAWLNAANEVAVEAFLDGRIGWTAIPDVLEAVLARHDGAMADGVDAVIDADRRARRRRRRRGRPRSSRMSDRQPGPPADRGTSRRALDAADAAGSAAALAAIVPLGLARSLARGSGHRLRVAAWPSSSCSLIVSIFLHELGHYLRARWAGMKVTEFFLGFGPRSGAPAGRDRVRRQGHPARRLREDLRHEQPRGGPAGGRGPHLPPQSLRPRVRVVVRPARR